MGRKLIVAVMILSLYSVMSFAGVNEDLLNAVQKNDIKKVTQLLQNGADINFKDKEGFTPLMFAAVNDYVEMTEHLLVYKGLDINFKNIYGYSAITMASIFGNTDVVKVLKKAGAKE